MRLPEPWSSVPRKHLQAVRGVLTDIDDTLTRAGAIEPAALAALHALADADVPVIAITGRPQGWSEPFARDWPVAAIVAENGAVAMFREGDLLRVEYAQDEATRAANARRLDDVAQRIVRDVDGAALARDSAGRVTDIAIDHAEFAHLDAARIARVVELMESAGMNATVSSIHVNGWFGEHDKWSGARAIVRRRSARDLDSERERERWVYVGDSPNDQIMFAHFPLSVGVANLRDFAERLHTWPAYITDGARGTGFAEVARALIEARSRA